MQLTSQQLHELELLKSDHIRLIQDTINNDTDQSRYGTEGGKDYKQTINGMYNNLIKSIENQLDTKPDNPSK